MTLQKRIATAIATGALLLNMAGPAFATEIVISGNGRDSDNDIVANVSQNTSVNQTNTANFTNTVNASADTGGNEANDNDGENVEVESGNATVNTTIVNEANVNRAQVNCCPSGNTTVEISGNDRDSNNTIDFDQDQNVDVDQDNDADFNNDVDADADTGGNEANDNDGEGSVRVSSGDAKVITTILNRANLNSAVVGGGDNEGGSILVRIADNDRNSDNDITLDLDSDVSVDQDNEADFDNDVNADADTGWNEANDNDATNVEVESGDATADTFVANHANFNHAELDCGCLFEDGLKVAVVGNDRDSDNNINADLNFDQDADQDNDADFDNDVDADADTGWNEANDNDGQGESSDPSVTSGDAKDLTDLVNHANLNALGNDLPDFDFSFDWNDLLDWVL